MPQAPSAWNLSSAPARAVRPMKRDAATTPQSWNEVPRRPPAVNGPQDGGDAGDGLVVGVFEEGGGERLAADPAGLLAEGRQLGRRRADDAEPGHGAGNGGPSRRPVSGVEGVQAPRFLSGMQLPRGVLRDGHGHPWRHRRGQGEPAAKGTDAAPRAD